MISPEARAAIEARLANAVKLAREAEGRAWASDSTLTWYEKDVSALLAALAQVEQEKAELSERCRQTSATCICGAWLALQAAKEER